MRRWRRFGTRLDRRIRRSAFLLVVLGGVAVAGLTWCLLAVRTEPPNQVDLTRAAWSVVAGIGGAVVLMAAYRWQIGRGRGRFADLFGAAAQQLGDPDPVVRLAGVYAMAGVADDFPAPARRQQCVDVLCGYLRLPYRRESGADHLLERTEKSVIEGAEVLARYRFRQNDREVRRTIVDVIAAHLRPSADISWSERDFDFTDALFEDADFRHAVFDGERTSFDGAVFVGERPTTFEYARFTGRHTSFRAAAFRGAAALFREARFDSAGNAGATDRGSGVVFDEAVFDTRVSFERGDFRGHRVSFRDTVFRGPRTSFDSARFPVRRVSFDGVTFEGEQVLFSRTEFGGDRISFAGARFYAVRTSFDGARLGARRRTGVLDFTRAEYHSAVCFDDAVFDGRVADFSRGDFFGDISFRRASFGAREVRFIGPKAWVGVLVDWDDHPTRRPTAVRPEMWPPAPLEPAPAE